MEISYCIYDLDFNILLYIIFNLYLYSSNRKYTCIVMLDNTLQILTNFWFCWLFSNGHFCWCIIIIQLQGRIVLYIICHPQRSKAIENSFITLKGVIRVLYPGCWCLRRSCYANNILFRRVRDKKLQPL